MRTNLMASQELVNLILVYSSRFLCLNKIRYQHNFNIIIVGLANPSCNILTIPSSSVINVGVSVRPASLRGAVGYSLWGDNIYGSFVIYLSFLSFPLLPFLYPFLLFDMARPITTNTSPMDAGFTLGQVCTNNLGTCSAGAFFFKFIFFFLYVKIFCYTKPNVSI
jgi:hypothetical protein